MNAPKAVATVYGMHIYDRFLVARDTSVARLGTKSHHARDMHSAAVWKVPTRYAMILVTPFGPEWFRFTRHNDFRGGRGTSVKRQKSRNGFSTRRVHAHLTPCEHRILQEPNGFVGNNIKTAADAVISAKIRSQHKTQIR